MNTSKRRSSHLDSIDKIIKAAVPPSQINTREIQCSSKPNEIISEISDQERIKNEICLLIGSVGSGKSTFTDYLRTVALPRDLSNSTQWVNINLNTAPLAKDKIYEWIVQELIKALKDKDGKRDFDSLETLKILYQKSLMKIKKGRASLFQKDSSEYLKIISDELSRLQNSPDETLKALIEFICTDRKKLLIVVFDNCDKRNMDDQLLMFEVASWLKKEFVCSIFLPLRDSTYDLYCNEPPLDTVIKDLVFRIDPPLLERVIYERLNFALRENENINMRGKYHL